MEFHHTVAGKREEREREDEQRITPALMTESRAQPCGLLKDAKVVFARYVGKRRPSARRRHRFAVNEMPGAAYERGINSQPRDN